jgi:2-dehydro-3-deoxygluconokinase
MKTRKKSGPHALACFGECMVELKPQKEGLWQQGYAGDTCNTAVYLARLLAPYETRVHWVMGVGEDRFALEMRAFWQQEGLDDSLSRVVPRGKTGLYAIHVDEAGERSFSYWRDTSAAKEYFNTPDALATPLELNSERLGGLHFSAISLAILPPSARERLFECALKVRQSGGLVSFDTNYRPALWRDAGEALGVIRKAMGLATCVLASMDEWMALTGEKDESVAYASLKEVGSQEMVVKRGGQDTWVSVASGPKQVVPVATVVRPVDTTAAGDAFAAGYLAARVLGQAPFGAACAGNQLAATVLMHPGALIPLEAMPDLGFDCESGADTGLNTKNEGYVYV